jgi:hypothetical protein
MCRFACRLPATFTLRPTAAMLVTETRRSGRGISANGILALALLLEQTVMAHADAFADGLAAVQRGDYATALRLW